MSCKYCGENLIGNETPLADGSYICNYNCLPNNNLDQRRRRQQARRQQEISRLNVNLDRLEIVNCQQCDHSYVKTICFICRPEE